MLKKLFILIFIVAATGCIKETYNMDKLSKEAHLSPTWGVAAVRGDISFSDLVDPNDSFDPIDSVIFDENNFVRLVFREDSVIDLKMEDYYDLNDMISFNEVYQLGDLKIAPFSGSIKYTLDQISQNLSPVQRAQFLALDGTNSVIPPFPVTNIGEKTYSPFSNFENVTFKEGSLIIYVKNNLPAPVSGISLRIFNTAGHIPIGNESIIPLINPGQIDSIYINVANIMMGNSITAAISLGTPGTSTPVLIDLDVQNIEVNITGKDMLVKSGRAIVPPQNISAIGEGDNIDTVSFDPGSGVEVTLIDVTKGDISYSVRSKSQLTSIASVTLLSALKNGVPLTESLTVNPNSTYNGTLSLDNTVIDMSTIATQPYNMVVVEHEIIVHSNNTMIDFSSTDELELNLKLLNTNFNYAKGYFGQKTESFDPDTLDLGIKDILKKISGDFLISSPSIKLNYANSFAVPVEINLQATGYRAAETVDLGLAPFSLSYPAAPGERDKEDVFIINKNNSSLSPLVSMPPEIVRFSGSAKMNPLGNTGSRDNYIFGNSRFLGSLEVEIPLEFRMNNLQFTDTVDNFMQEEENSEDNPVNPEDFEFLRIDIKAENGFPLGVSLSMMLYDSVANVNRSTIEAENILEPAPVDNNGHVTGPTECSTSIKITRDFWNWVNKADKIIFMFTMNTTADGSKDVKIYSDYKINFKASLVLKPDIKFNLDSISIKK